MVREHLADMVDQGLVTPTGLISHGRGEAFDYLMGEKTIAPALEAERAAAAFLLKAQRPMVCVNGNSVALDPKGLIGLAKAVPAKMEVNIFHRTEERMEQLIAYMESQGAEGILGRNPDSRIPNLTSDRALCTKEGIYDSDVIVVPIEDGDRAEALTPCRGPPRWHPSRSRTRSPGRSPTSPVSWRSSGATTPRSRGSSADIHLKQRAATPSSASVTH